ncbi:hypothetical protein OIV83_002597 [Microbotryomycetes sp. JL201]|nr:hypothetical protein OIV83_002597 [Microbotryomycetes sp. JL201]
MPAWDLDDDEWQDMPVIPPSSSSSLSKASKSTAPASSSVATAHRDLDNDEDGLDELDDDPRAAASRNRSHRHALGTHTLHSSSVASAQLQQGRQIVGNATGKLIDVDSHGAAWREKDDIVDKQEELDYTRLDLDDDPQEDEISMRTQYLFNEDKGMTPLSQMQATKTLLTEGQRIAYVGLCKLVSREMIQTLAIAAKGAPELVQSRESAKAWATKIMGRLYRHMEVDTAEQRMIDQLAEHGVTADDLVPSLLTTYTVDNPEYDPEAEAQEAEEELERQRIEEQERNRQEQRMKRERDQLEREKQILEEAEQKRKESEEAGRVARQVAKIERRQSQALEQELTGSPGSPRTPSRKSSRPGSLKSPVPGSPIKSPSASVRGRFPSWDETGDITSAIQSTSLQPSLPIDSKRRVDAMDESAESETARPKDEEPTTPKARPPRPLSDDDDANLNETDKDSILKPMPSSLPGVSTKLSPADKTITLDIRWTILCDLWLSLIADSVYDARSRVLLGRVAEKLGLEWMDVVRFERRLTEALELQESVANKEHGEVLEGRAAKEKRSRYVMMGLATLGGGLVIGLSAGLLAPVIGAGLGAALTTVGVTGTTGFLAGAGGSAIIASGATLTGGMIGGKAMAKRTRHVKTFEFLPLHNNKRLNCYVTIPGFMNGLHDDVRLPFSTMDPLMGDVFSVLWEPEMMGDTGNALRILSSEVLTQAGQQVLAMTVLTALMSAIQWPMMLTKLSYLIDNPWSNALDRAKQAGAVLADILLHRRLGVRPVSLVGFSLGARVIFYALVELAKANAFGVVQEVYLFGATVTATLKKWRQVRGVVSGRFVNAFAMNDWVLGYLFRATTGGLQTVAGLRPIEHVPDLENIDVTHLLTGHMSYRPLMPALLDFVGFKVLSDHFDEPDDMDPDGPDREVLTKEEEERRQAEKEKKKLGIVGRLKLKKTGSSANGSAAGSAPMSRSGSGDYDELPPRLDSASSSSLTKTLGSDSKPASSTLSLSTADGADIAVQGATKADSTSIHKTAEDTLVDTPTEEASPEMGSTGVFNIEKLKEEVSSLPNKADNAPSDRPTSAMGSELSVVGNQARLERERAPSAPAASSALPTTDLRNLDTTLDPKELLRKQWNGEYVPPPPPSAFSSEADSPWAAPPANPFATTLPPSSAFTFDSFTSGPRIPHAETSFTFASSDGGFGTMQPAPNDLPSWEPTAYKHDNPNDDDDAAPDPASNFVWSTSIDDPNLTASGFNRDKSSTGFNDPNPW